MTSRHLSQPTSESLRGDFTFDLIGLPPHPTKSTRLSATHSPTPGRGLSSACWPRRAMANGGDGTGWMSFAMPTPRETMPTIPCPKRGYIATTSSMRSTPTSRLINSRREQLAGDLLAAAGPREQYAERIVATGFLALSRRYATAPYELWHLTLEDTIDTVGRAFLGLSLPPHRCHDHKFDPVTTADYYALYGMFASTKFAYAGWKNSSRRVSLGPISSQLFLPVNVDRESRNTVHKSRH